MDWDRVVERNREALKHVLAALAAMAGLRDWPISPLEGEMPGRAEGGVSRDGTVPPSVGSADISPARGEIKPTLPRHHRNAVLRLLRPAEAAARRLIVVAARDIAVELPPPGRRQPKGKSAFVRSGTGIALPRGWRVPRPLTPADKGAGDSETFAPKRLRKAGSTWAGSVAATTLPSPLRGGVRGGGRHASARLAFSLLDPPRRLRLLGPSKSRRTVPPHAAPRIAVPGITALHRLPPPPSPDDAIDATRLRLRLAALARALDDLPGHARRLARWKARRDHEAARAALPRRLSPLRTGPPPGLRRPGSRRQPAEVDEALADLHHFALAALRAPDTS